MKRTHRRRAEFLRGITCLLYAALSTSAALPDAESLHLRASQFLSSISIVPSAPAVEVRELPNGNERGCPTCLVVSFPSGEEVTISPSDGEVVGYYSSTLARSANFDVLGAPVSMAEAIASARLAMTAAGTPQEFRFSSANFVSPPGRELTAGFWDTFWVRTHEGVSFHSDFAHVFVHAESGSPFLLNKRKPTPIPSSLIIAIPQALAIDVAQATLIDEGRDAQQEPTVVLQIVVPNRLWGAVDASTGSRLAWVVDFGTEIVFVDAETAVPLGGDRTLLLQNRASAMGTPSQQATESGRAGALLASPESIVGFVARRFLAEAGASTGVPRSAVHSSPQDCAHCWIVRSDAGDELVIRLLPSGKEPYAEVLRFTSPQAHLEASETAATRRFDEVSGIARVHHLLGALGLQTDTYQITRFDFTSPSSNESAAGVWHSTVQLLSHDPDPLGADITLSFDASSGRLISLERRFPALVGVATGHSLVLYGALLGGVLVVTISVIIRLRRASERMRPGPSVVLREGGGSH